MQKEKEEKKEDVAGKSLTGRRTGVRAGKKRLIPVLFAFFFSGAMVFGFCLEKQGSVPFKSLSLWAAFLILFGITQVLATYFLELYQSKSLCRAESIVKEPTFQKKQFVLTALILFGCYFIVFLGVYPGFFVYDAQEELMQVVTRQFSTHHPLFHVLLLGGMIQLFHKLTESYNAGIAAYTLFQMGVLSLIFSYVICSITAGRKKWIRGFVLFYGMFPTIVMYVLCSAKDGLFMGMVLLIVTLLRQFFQEPEKFIADKVKLAVLFGASVLMMLFRHNGVYAFLLFGILMLLFLRKQKTRTLLAGFLLSILFYFLISQELAAVLHAETGEHQEMLTVPIQQMARVYAYERDSLTEEQKTVLYEILPEEALLRYTPKVSDTVKIDFKNEVFEKDPVRYGRLWIEIGSRHPFAYLNAWFMTSYGFWYPAVIDAYRGNTVFTFTYEDSSYFGYEVEQPGIRNSLFPVIDHIYRWLSLKDTIQKLPVVSLLFAPSFYFWVLLWFLCCFLYTGKTKMVMPYLLPLLIWLTVLLGPVSLPRYVVYLWVLVPVAFLDFWGERTNI